MSRPKRTRILIDSLQYRLLLVNLIYFFTVILVFASVVFAPTVIGLRSGDWEQQQQAANQFLFLHASLWPAIIVVFVLLVAHSIMVSHRIAGPLYRFRRVFSAVGDGDLTLRAGIRERDYLRKDADSINQMITGLSRILRGVEQEAVEVAALVGELDRALEKDPRQTRVLVERLEHRVSELTKTTFRIRLREEGTSGETSGDGGRDAVRPHETGCLTSAS
jgi:methyl-accepting chemotaxis protein